MIKRLTSATSVLVAAAAIISMVPAYAADYQKIDSKEGTIYNAVAYKDGQFYIDGGVNDKDDATYYLANGQYNNLSDIGSGSSVDTYGSKYVDVQNGDYFIDLTNGQVTDDSVKENAEDDAASALRKNIKKDNDGRYNTTDAEAIKVLAGKELAGNKFSDVWYGITYQKDGSSDQLNVYTDANGNYIDADYNLGSIKVTTTGSGAEKTVTVANTKDQYDSANTTKAVTAGVSSATVIGQDANYIYRTATVTVTVSGSDTISKINGKAITSPVFSTPGTTTTHFQVIQKISKAQASGDVDGAKYAKSVNTYVVSKDDATAESTLLNDYTVSNGKIINYAVTGGSIETQTITLSAKNGYNYTDIADKSTEDATVVDKDANGNLWRLEAGYIYKWDNNEDWTKVYKVDGSFDKMSVYDDKNIVTWNEDDEVYSVIGGQDQTTEPTTPATNKGWVNTNTGWTFYKADGTQVKGQWVNDGGVWYYIKADGIMATGWVNDNGTWYFLQSSGAMKTGWVKDGANWYYLKSSGAMATGWVNDNGTWYYLNASGAMLANTIVDGYKLGASGAWIK